MAVYTVAVLSDIHGNLAALDAVLADLAAQPHDATVIAGDLAVNGPYPAEVLARVRALGVPVIHGNTDRFLVEADDDPVVRWTREQLREDDLAYLAALPFEHRITPPGGVSPADDLLIVHATPTDVNAILFTERSPGGTAPTPPPLASALLGEARANLILYGHIHYASSGTIRGQRLASIGAVGFPFDDDRRAAYALVSWAGRAWRVAHRRVAHDHLAVIAALRQVGVPRADLFARRLAEASFIPVE